MSKSEGHIIRTADKALLARQLQSVRSRTLTVFDAYEVAGALSLPCKAEYNLPLWEMGHIAWFQEWWIGRNMQRDLGWRAWADAPRGASVITEADAMYDSTKVPHKVRWQLPLLDARACRAYLQASLDQTLLLLSDAGPSDEALYFYRLVLLHEAMHLEAALYMAQAIGGLFCNQIAPDFVANNSDFICDSKAICLESQIWILGSQVGGFSFDNELPGHAVVLQAFEIDAHPVRWQAYMAFVESTGHALPRYVRRADGLMQPWTPTPGQSASGYDVQRWGRWQPMDMQQAAVHLSYADALTYCEWAGRRLPSEAQWECAAMSQRGFAWGHSVQGGGVWEWTASAFGPYPGFAPHPYQDYSVPWFARHGAPRIVLRGASGATPAIMAHPKYRNYFAPDRCDVFVGFRTCAR